MFPNETEELIDNSQNIIYAAQKLYIMKCTLAYMIYIYKHIVFVQYRARIRYITIYYIVFVTV